MQRKSASDQLHKSALASFNRDESKIMYAKGFPEHMAEPSSARSVRVASQFIPFIDMIMWAKDPIESVRKHFDP
jgi:hypothetical protein